MLPLVLLGKEAAATALLWGAPPAPSRGESGNLVLECNCMMWKAESLKWRGEKRCTMHTHIVTFFLHYKIMHIQYAVGTMLLFLANTQNIGAQYWRDLNNLQLILQETLMPSVWKKLQKMVLFTAEFFFSVLLDPLYCWQFWGVASIAVAGEGAAHHLLLGWFYSVSSLLQGWEKV